MITAFSEDVDPQESEEDYFADAENSSCTSSDDDDGASLSDIAGWSECLNGKCCSFLFYQNFLCCRDPFVIKEKIVLF